MMNADHEKRPGAVDYDAELRRHQEVLHRACGIRSRDHVLDIGCGTGHTTRHAARMAPMGSALGVDVSASAIERARELAHADELLNVAFECADAQVYRFPPGRFDLAISRFGTMFFQEPAAAFANIRRALRPGGRLVMMVWQAQDRNEWDVTIRQSLGGSLAPAAFAPAGPDPFSLADPPACDGGPGDCGIRGRRLRRRPRARATTARIWQLLSTGSAASRAAAMHSGSSRPPMRNARSGGCEGRSPTTCARTVSGSIPVPGSSPRATGELEARPLVSRHAA